MRDVNGGDADLLLNAADLGAHRNAQLGVEIGERFVKEQDTRLDNERTGKRHTLAFAARKLTWAAIRKIPGIVKACGLHAAFKDLPQFSRLVAEFQPKRHVIENAHVQQIGILQEQGCLLAALRTTGIA